MPPFSQYSGLQSEHSGGTKVVGGWVGGGGVGALVVVGARSGSTMEIVRQHYYMYIIFMPKR